MPWKEQGPGQHWFEPMLHGGRGIGQRDAQSCLASPTVINSHLPQGLAVSLACSWGPFPSGIVQGPLPPLVPCRRGSESRSRAPRVVWCAWPGHGAVPPGSARRSQPGHTGLFRSLLGASVRHAKLRADAGSGERELRGLDGRARERKLQLNGAGAPVPGTSALGPTRPAALWLGACPPPPSRCHGPTCFAALRSPWLS